MKRIDAEPATTREGTVVCVRKTAFLALALGAGLVMVPATAAQRPSIAPLGNAQAVLQRVHEMSERWPRPILALFDDGRVASLDWTDGRYSTVQLTPRGKRNLLALLERVAATPPAPSTTLGSGPLPNPYPCPSDVGDIQLVTPGHPAPLNLPCNDPIPSVISDVRSGTFDGIDRNVATRRSRFARFAVVALRHPKGEPVPPGVRVRTWRGPALRTTTAPSGACTVVSDRNTTIEINDGHMFEQLWRVRGTLYYLQTLPLVSESGWCTAPLAP